MRGLRLNGSAMGCAGPGRGLRSKMVLCSKLGGIHCIRDAIIVGETYVCRRLDGDGA